MTKMGKIDGLESLCLPDGAAPGRALVWLRRDLRTVDNHALYRALAASREVYCVFVFDTDILDALTDKADRRVEFIWESVAELQRALKKRGSGLIVLHGRAADLIPELAARLGVEAVYTNHDYEPSALVRDEAVRATLARRGTGFLTFKDQVVFEKDELLTQGGTPFSVFTPYKNAWLKRCTTKDLQGYPSEQLLDRLARFEAMEPPSLESMGFARTNLKALRIDPGASGASALFDNFLERIDQYHETRNFPAVRGPSYLSVHLRFGTISLRALARAARERRQRGADTWLNELIWRDFYFMILHHHPRVVDHAFRPELDGICYPGDRSRFEAWREGRTGYPLVDAAMKQLNTTGYMHNRLRMVTASFLVKDLHVDWRWGERYFAQRLNDYDLAANNGGWQWAASTGCDSQPYFRIFNPVTQSRKFDPDGRFIRKYLPVLASCDNKFVHEPWLMDAQAQAQSRVIVGRDYPAPMVDHAQARRVTLELYGRAMSQKISKRGTS